MTYLRRGAVIGAAVLGTAALAAPAFAAPAGSTANLDDLKKAVTARIDGRVSALAALDTAVGAATHLSDGHRTTLKNLIAADRSGLATLRGKVAAETTAAGVKSDAASMVNDYRVYLLVEPKVRLVIAADLETATSARLRTVADKLSAAIAAARQAGKDTGKADADLADLRAQLDAADAAVNGKADALLAVTPGPDADAIKGQVAPVRGAVHTAQADLKKATADAKDIRRILGTAGGS